MFTFAPRRPCRRAHCPCRRPGQYSRIGRRQGLQAQRSRRSRDQARGADQERCRHGDQAGRRLRRDADAAFQKNDFRTGMLVLGQLVTVAPTDATSWLRLSRARAADPAARRQRARAAARSRLDRRLYRLSAARATATWKPTAWRCSAGRFADRKNGARRLIPCGWRSICARPPTCAANTSACAPSTASACWITRSILTLFRRAPASSSPKNCPAGAPISRPMSRWPARTSRRSRRTTSSSASKASSTANATPITLRAGLPSVVRETLAKSADFTIFVRDRKPFVRFSGKAYVLPRSGQRGIPVLSVNTSAVALSVYRVGDRNLLDTVLGYDFQRNLAPTRPNGWPASAAPRCGAANSTSTPKLNTEVATAFPVDQALGDLKPGVYVMTAAPKDAVANDYDQRASQWFIVSDLGLTAYSGHDGIDVFIHSLASAEPSGAGRGPADRAQQRGAGGQAHRQGRLRAFRGRLGARRGWAGAGRDRRCR